MATRRRTTSQRTTSTPKPEPTTKEVTGFLEFDSKGNDKGYFSFKLGGEYYGTGKVNPELLKDDEVSFSAESYQGKNGKTYWSADPDTITILNQAEPETSGSGGGYDNAGAERGNARTNAVALLDIMVRESAIKLPAKQAAKYDALTGAYNDLVNVVMDSGIDPDEFNGTSEEGQETEQQEEANADD